MQISKLSEGAPKQDRRGAEGNWDNLQLPDRAIQQIAVDAIAIDVEQLKSPGEPAAEGKLTGEYLTRLHTEYGVSRYAIDQAVQRQASRSEMQNLRDESRSAILKRMGKEDASDNELIDFVAFEKNVEKAIADLPAITENAAKRGLKAVPEFRLHIPVNLLPFDEQKYNPGAKWNILMHMCPPILGSLILNDWKKIGRLDVYKYNPVLESVRHERMRALYALIDRLGLQRELDLDSMYDGSLSVRFKS